MSLGSRRRRESRRGDLPMTAEINVTSLIDVAFTLLVIFIITAPILQGGIEVRLPRAQVQPITAQDSPFIVSVDGSGIVYVGETPVPMDEFRSSFPQLYRAVNPNVVYIKGDSLAHYGAIYQVMATVARVTQEEGGRWGMLGEPEPRDGR
jgi:biopolymer transport protein TolR